MRLDRLSEGVAVSLGRRVAGFAFFLAVFVLIGLAARLVAGG